MDAITIDGLHEDDFRRSIENMLRNGQADEAAAKLRALLKPFVGEDGLLPPRFLTVSPDDLALTGWDQLGERIGQYDRPNSRISAFSVALTDPDEVAAHAGAAGMPAPRIETSYFSDEAYPFSAAARSDLLDGYSLYGCEWQGNFETTDSTLHVEGIDDLYRAIARLEAKLLASAEPSQEEIRAGSLAACYLAVLIHQAVRSSIRRNGLPRALCVMAGNNGVYPFFDAPVISSEEYREERAEVPDEEENVDAGGADPGYNSLLSMNLRKGKKKPVIVLDAAEAESAAREGELLAARHMAEVHEPAPLGRPPEFEVTVEDPPTPIEHPEQAFTAEDAGAEAPSAQTERFHRPIPDLAYRSNPDPIVAEPAVEPAPDPVDETPPAAEPTMPAVQAAATEEAAIAERIVPVADAAELAPAAPAAKPRFDPPGHRLRARIAETSRPRPTLAGRLASFLRWIGRPFRRPTE